jgi:signal transduction histidine kinase
MRWPLRYQILVPFAAVMLAVVLGDSLLDAYLAAQRTQSQLERQLDGMAQTLLNTNFPLTDSVLRQARGLSGAEFLLTDASGRPRATSLSGVELPILASAGGSGNHLRLGDTTVVAGAEYFHAAIAVRPRGASEPGQLLHILYPRRDLQDARWQAAYPSLVVGGILLGVVAVLATVIAGRLSRPILELRQQLSRLVQGQFRPVPLPARNDELRDLVRSANLLGDQLEESRRAIERAERLTLLGQLSGGLAHQLRNSVTGARLAVQLHQRHCGHGDRESLDVALRQLKITESHLQQFLSVGQPNSPCRARCDPRQLVGEVSALLAPACEHHRVSFVCDTPVAMRHELWIDAEQIRQLLVNLTQNAIEAAGTGGWVRITLADAGSAITLSVVDSGPGPSPAVVDHLFEPFATGKPEGVGLGLTVARRIAEAHGGTVRHLNSRPTCFEVVLPVIEPERAATPSTQVEAPSRTARQTLTAT